MFSTMTPDDIDKIDIDSVYKLIKDGESAKGLPSPKTRLRIIKMVFDVLGYDLTSDLAFALCAEPKAQLILSIAGGGKTTGAQIKAICEKIWRKNKEHPENSIRGNNVLCLVYNRHNIKPMEDKHREMVSRLKIAGIKGLDIDDNINASTMHSFCDQWRKEYVAMLGLMNYTLLMDDESERLMSSVMHKVLQKYNIGYGNTNTAASNVLALHNLAREKMCPIEELSNTDKFVEVDIDVSVLEEITSLYERMKKLTKKYDFTDMLVGVYNLFVSHPDILARVQKYYDYVIADEVQDFTPIMLKILHVLISDGTPLMCIGDDDQSIYKFRGADIYHTLHFDEEFDGGEVYLLSRNRRCRANILHLAKQVIDENQLRYHKQMRGIKGGGLVEYIPYSSIEGENINLLSRLKNLSPEQLDDSVICYRERVSSIMITELLEECKLPFYVIGGYSAFTHELYRDVIQVLNLLEAPMDPYCLLNLYKCTPLKKSQVYEALGFNAELGRFKKDPDKKHFMNIDFGSAMNVKGLANDLIRLGEISSVISKVPMIEYFDELFSMIKKFFWNFQKNTKGLPEVYDKFIEEKIYKMFNSDKTYPEVFAEYSKRKEMVKLNQAQKYGVAISTFHGLKGLEFSNVFIMDLDDSLFPNFSLIDSKRYDPETKQLLKECETCLYYVAVTRAKDNLYLYYNERDPSRYVSLYNGANLKYEDISEHNMNYMRLFEESAESAVSPELAKEEQDDLDDIFEVFDSFDEPENNAIQTVEFQSNSGSKMNSFMQNLLNF